MVGLDTEGNVNLIQVEIERLRRDVEIDFMNSALLPEKLSYTLDRNPVVHDSSTAQVCPLVKLVACWNEEVDTISYRDVDEFAKIAYHNVICHHCAMIMYVEENNG